MAKNEEAPRGAGQPQDRDAWVSDLKITDDKAMALIVLRLATEVHDFALSSGVASHSVKDQLSLVFGVLNSHLADFVSVTPVVAVDASDFAAIRVGFSPEGYRRIAIAAKDRVADAVD